MPEHTYGIVPYSGYAWLIVMAALLVPMAFIGYAMYSSRHATFVVSSEGIRIRGDLYGRKIPAANIRAAEVRVANLNTDAELGLSWRTNGVGLPGYKAGWFRTRGGGKALVFVTDASHVAAVPTTDGYTLLLSVADPESLVRDVRAVASGQAF